MTATLWSGVLAAHRLQLLQALLVVVEEAHRHVQDEGVAVQASGQILEALAHLYAHACHLGAHLAHLGPHLLEQPDGVVLGVVSHRSGRLPRNGAGACLLARRGAGAGGGEVRGDVRVEEVADLAALLHAPDGVDRGQLGHRAG